MIALVPRPPYRRYGRPLPLLAVSDGPRVLGQIAEVTDFVWWFRLPGSPYFGPAAGPSQRDAVAALLWLADAPPPPRRGIPSRLKIVSREGEPDAEGT